jgi:predicted 2-oxoglutarate/Fe(II)-dependent dioxygenase YbiX
VCKHLRFNGLQAVGLNNNIRFYRYSPGQRFGRHVDDSVMLPTGQTGYTLLVYLNGSCPGNRLVGGETVFYGSRGQKLHSVSPKGGLVVLHLHGDDCWEHEGAEVQQGVKYLLRSDVVFSALDATLHNSGSALRE